MRPFVQIPYERRGVTAEWGRALDCRDGFAALPPGSSGRHRGPGRRDEGPASARLVSMTTASSAASRLEDLPCPSTTGRVIGFGSGWGQECGCADCGLLTDWHRGREGRKTAQPQVTGYGRPLAR